MIHLYEELDNSIFVVGIVTGKDYFQHNGFNPGNFVQWYKVDEDWVEKNVIYLFIPNGQKQSSIEDFKTHYPSLPDKIIEKMYENQVPIYQMAIPEKQAEIMQSNYLDKSDESRKREYNRIKIGDFINENMEVYGLLSGNFYRNYLNPKGNFEKWDEEENWQNRPVLMIKYINNNEKELTLEDVQKYKINEYDEIVLQDMVDKQRTGIRIYARESVALYWKKGSESA